MRLAFCKVRDDHIDEGVARLAALIASKLAPPR
jgi:DNA-binding transcriptional MocR family regulator